MTDGEESVIEMKQLQKRERKGRGVEVECKGGVIVPAENTQWVPSPPSDQCLCLQPRARRAVEMTAQISISRTKQLGPPETSQISNYGCTASLSYLYNIMLRKLLLLVLIKVQSDYGRHVRSRMLMGPRDLGS